MNNDKIEDEFPGNSKSSRVAPIRASRRIREEDETVNKTEKRTALAVKPRAIRRKRTLVESIARAFVGDEARGVLQYIIGDILIPAAKSMLQDSVTSGIEMILFGEARPKSRSKDRGRGESSVSYGSFYRGRDRDDRRDSRSSSSRGRFNLEDIFFTRGDDATEVLDELGDMLEQYEQVTVADFYELAGVDGATWADQKWGWKDLRKAFCTHTREGYSIVLPRPIELD